MQVASEPALVSRQTEGSGHYCRAGLEHMVACQKNYKEVVTRPGLGWAVGFLRCGALGV